MVCLSKIGGGGVSSMNPAGIAYLINEEEAAAPSFLMAVTDMGVVS